MNQSLKALARSLLGSLRDLLPVILVVLFFQLAVLQQPLPNVGQLLFEQFGLSRAPVLERGRVIGIVSFTDMVLRGLEDINDD